MARNSDLADFGPSASAGAVLEEFCSPCDGSAITVRSGTYTVGNVTGAMGLTTTHADVTGSSIDYTPPTGTQTVIYEFSFQVAYVDGRVIIHIKLMLDNDSGTPTEVVYAKKTIFAHSESHYLDSFYTFKWPFHIGGSDSTNTGRVDTWTSARTIKLMAREYGSSYEAKLNVMAHWDGSMVETLSQPVIGIRALA